MLFVATFIFSLAFAARVYGEEQKDTVYLQIDKYNKTHPEPPGNLTTSNGAPIEEYDYTLKNNHLLLNPYFLESISSLVHENIPERVVHGKGAGAFGYFNVTRNVTQYTKASFLSEIGSITSLAVRFSLALTGKGGCDTNREPRGFSVKFITSEGNFDMLGLNIPVMFISNPVYFSAFAHALKRNPVTNMPSDPNMVWDFLLTRPEAFNAYIRILGLSGLFDGYRGMPGYSLHTYRLVNNEDVISYCRFVIKPKDGPKYLNSSEALRLAGEEPDYSTKDLYNAIENGDFPCWTFYIQPFTEDDIRRDCDLLDVTIEPSTDKYPLVEVGEVCLNKNINNYFADVEQIAFNPCNLVPGIMPALDKMYESRCFAYREAQQYRLGVNFNNIDINYPKQSNALNYNRDGVAPVHANGGGAPNYGPNSYKDLKRVDSKYNNSLHLCSQHVSNNSKQLSDYYEGLPELEKNEIISNIVSSLSNAIKPLQVKTVDVFNELIPSMGEAVYEGLKAAAASS